MRIGIIGSGGVAQTLAAGFLKHEHDVTLGTRHPDTNPIADAPPDHGVLKFFTSLDQSLLEQLQREFGAARFVKAFNSVGAALM